MKVLIACEFSGIVRDVFAANGHEAISCDLLATEIPGPHYQGDVFDLLSDSWDMIIGHPPCTALTVAGNSTYGSGMEKYSSRIEAVEWTERLWNSCIAAAPRVCFENPVGVLSSMSKLPKPFYIQPYQFGHLEQKKTGLFLHNLPPLKEENNVYESMMELPRRVRERLHYLPPSPDRWKVRSRTFTGIASAMANQWGKE